jgi:peroxiredoxin Q/BCP
MRSFGIACALLVFGCEKPAEPAPAGSASAAPAAATPNADALLKEGAPAPDLTATAHNGEKVSLASLKGKPVVVYFYPKDDTPGCTVEAKGIKEHWADLSGTGAVVIGISTDDEASHKAFAEKYELPFLLVPDPDARIAGMFGVPLRNNHASRVTFLIGKDGKIAKVYPAVKPDGHAAELLAAIRTL